MAKITLQRVYDFSAPAPEHCYLIDRLWPRGISKELTCSPLINTPRC